MQTCWGWHMQNLYLEMGVLYSVRCSSYVITIYCNLTPEAPQPHTPGSMHSDTNKRSKFTAIYGSAAVPSQTRFKVYLATSTPLHVLEELVMTKSLARAEG